MEKRISRGKLISCLRPALSPFRNATTSKRVQQINITWDTRAKWCDIILPGSDSFAHIRIFPLPHIGYSFQLRERDIDTCVHVCVRQHESRAIFRDNLPFALNLSNFTSNFVWRAQVAANQPDVLLTTRSFDNQTESTFPEMKTPRQLFGSVLK